MWTELLKTMNMTEITAQGDLKWMPTRLPRGYERGGHSKLDLICVSDTLLDKGLITNVNIGAVIIGLDAKISDHKMLTMELKLKVSRSRIMYSLKESFKTEEFKSCTKNKAFRNEIKTTVHKVRKILNHNTFNVEDKKQRQDDENLKS